MCIQTDFILIYEWYSRQQNTQECRSYSVVRPLLEQNFVKGQLTQFTKSICIIAGGNSVIIHSCLVCLPTREAPTHYWDFCETSVRTNPSASSTRAQITWLSSLLFWVISFKYCEIKNESVLCSKPTSFWSLSNPVSPALFEPKHHLTMGWMFSYKFVSYNSEPV